MRQMIIWWTPDADTLLELTAGKGDGEARSAGRCMDGSQYKRESLGLRFEKSNIGDLLDTSKIEAGRYTISPQPLEVSQIFEEALSLLAPLALSLRLLSRMNGSAGERRFWRTLRSRLSPSMPGSSQSARIRS